MGFPRPPFKPIPQAKKFAATSFMMPSSSAPPDEEGHDIRRVQELLGHKVVSATMVCTYVRNRSRGGARSPLDR